MGATPLRRFAILMALLYGGAILLALAGVDVIFDQQQVERFVHLSNVAWHTGDPHPLTRNSGASLASEQGQGDTAL